MQNQVFNRTLYNNELIEQYEYLSIMPTIASGKFSDLATQGTTIINESLEDFEAVDYNGTLVYSELAKLTQNVLVDQSKQVAKYIHRGDEWVTDYDLQDKTKKKTAKTFAKTSDAYHLEKMRSNAGDVLNIEGVTLTKDNILAQLINPLVEIMDNNDVDKDDRYIITDSATKNIIEDLDIYSSNEGLEGNWNGTVKGFKIVQTNLLPANVNTATFKDSIALQKDAYEFLNGVATTEIGQSELKNAKYFYSVVDYGGDVLTTLNKGVIKISRDETV